MLKIGIIGQSFKENEKRLPIHPADFKHLNPLYKNIIYIDKNYGINFGYSDLNVEISHNLIFSSEKTRNSNLIFKIRIQFSKLELYFRNSNLNIEITQNLTFF